LTDGTACPKVATTRVVAGPGGGEARVAKKKAAKKKK
jgi:hypothetical protein